MYNLIQAKRTDLVASGMLTLRDVLLHKLYFVSNIPHALLTSLNFQNMDTYNLRLSIQMFFFFSNYVSFVVEESAQMTPNVPQMGFI
jgi:hypothetical protein